MLHLHHYYSQASKEEKCEENQAAFFEGLVFFLSEGAMILDTLSRLLNDSYVQPTNALATLS